MGYIGKAAWDDSAGKRHAFDVYEWSDEPELESRAGVYILARPAWAGEGVNGWAPLYIGESGDIQSRLSGAHEGVACAKVAGLTAVHVLYTDCDGSIRKDIEERLMERHVPPCNIEITKED